jgi:hypothetical protein
VSLLGVPVRKRSKSRVCVLIASMPVCVGLMLWIIPRATADPGEAYVRTESGRVHCMVTTNDQGHGGGPAVVCDSSGPDSTGFMQAPIAVPESQCRNSPSPGGLHWGLAAVTAGGAFR